MEIDNDSYARRVQSSVHNQDLQLVLVLVLKHSTSKQCKESTVTIRLIRPNLNHISFQISVIPIESIFRPNALSLSFSVPIFVPIIIWMHTHRKETEIPKRCIVYLCVEMPSNLLVENKWNTNGMRTLYKSYGIGSEWQTGTS